MKPKTIIILILVVLLAVILVQNIEGVDVQLFFWKLSMSRIILISLSMIIGLLIGFFIGKKGKKY